MEVLVPVLALVGALVTGVVAWLVARRGTSGSVRTSEAATLWTESQAIRTELREEAKMLRHDLANTKLMLDLVRAEAADCRLEGLKMLARIAVLERHDGDHG